jgi:TPR repeat protein
MNRMLVITLLVQLAAATSAFSQSKDVYSGISLYHEKKYIAAFDTLRPAAEKGNALAQYYLGEMYYAGKGVVRNFLDAKVWYERAARQGHGSGQYGLGRLYDLGHGVPQQDEEALRWYRLAAEQGIVAAQEKLGDFYNGGRSFSKHSVMAHMWYNVGCAPFADISICEKRDRLRQSMTQSDISEAQRRARVCMESNYKDCD